MAFPDSFCHGNYATIPWATPNPPSPTARVGPAIIRPSALRHLATLAARPSLGKGGPGFSSPFSLGERRAGDEGRTRLLLSLHPNPYTLTPTPMMRGEQGFCSPLSLRRRGEGGEVWPSPVRGEEPTEQRLGSDRQGARRAPWVLWSAWRAEPHGARRAGSGGTRHGPCRPE